MRRASVVIGALVAAAGCTSGPDYHVPEHAAALTPSANHAFLGADQTGISQAPLPDRWWTLYNDPRLDGYVAEALRANADLRAADANLRRAAALVREAEDSRSVHTDIEAEALESRVGGYTLPLPGTPFSYVLGVTATLPLDLAGGLRRGIEEAGAVSEATQATRDQVRVVVAAAVARSYAGVCSANWSLAAAQHVVDVQTETLSAINRNVRGGRGTSFDATRARAAVDLSAAALPPLLADRQRALFELAELMGRPAAANPIEAESCATPPSLKQPIPIGDGARLIQRRPDIRAAERQLAASTAGIGVATAQLYPQINLGGSVGLAGPSSIILSSTSFGGSVGPFISWTFPNRSAARARIDAAGADADAALARFDGAVLQALRQVETALAAYGHEIEHEQTLARARDDAAEAKRQATILFTNGRASVIDVLASDAALASAESALAASQARVIDRQIDLFLALGGGWEMPVASSEQASRSE